MVSHRRKAEYFGEVKKLPPMYDAVLRKDGKDFQEKRSILVRWQSPIVRRKYCQHQKKTGPLKRRPAFRNQKPRDYLEVYLVWSR